MRPSSHSSPAPYAGKANREPGRDSPTPRPQGAQQARFGKPGAKPRSKSGPFKRKPGKPGNAISSAAYAARGLTMSVSFYSR